MKKHDPLTSTNNSFPYVYSLDTKSFVTLLLTFYLIPSFTSVTLCSDDFIRVTVDICRTGLLYSGKRKVQGPWVVTFTICSTPIY